MNSVTLLPSLALLLSMLAQSPVALEKEPRHQLKFENQSVRVFYVLIPPGEATLFHTHVHDGVGVKLTDARIRNEVLGGSVVEFPVKRGAVEFTRRPSPLTHRVTNTGTTPFRNILVEILPPSGLPGRAPSPAAVTGDTMVLENERVRVRRMVLAPGQSTGEDTVAPRGVHIAVSRGKILVTNPGKEARMVKFEPGDCEWHEGGRQRFLRNVGSTSFEVVDIELK